MRKAWIAVITSPIWVPVAVGLVIVAQIFREDSKASRGRRP